jgi:hypothetical protein
MKLSVLIVVCLLPLIAAQPPAALRRSCAGCHNEKVKSGGLNLADLPFSLSDPSLRAHWVHIFDRIEKGEMPPNPAALSASARDSLLKELGGALREADLEDVKREGRGPLRRLSREEYENNLRDLLLLPDLDVGRYLPEDRKNHGFNKSSDALDFSRIQLAAYLEAADAALAQAVAPSVERPPAREYRRTALELLEQDIAYGGPRAMFFAQHNKRLLIPAIGKMRAEKANPEGLELALFRSAFQPFYGHIKNFQAPATGRYRVRFIARAVIHDGSFTLKPAPAPQAFSFRARKPDILTTPSVRNTGGIIDILPEPRSYETEVLLDKGQVLEVNPLGLPVPRPIETSSIKGGLTTRLPEIPPGGDRGVGFTSIDIEGPLYPAAWPPPSHTALFGNLPMRSAPKGSRWAVEVVSPDPPADAVRLLRYFAERAARGPVSLSESKPYEDLVLAKLNKGASFTEALLFGYKAILCSGQFLYLREPSGPSDSVAIASRLSHFLWNTRPDDDLIARARKGLTRAETDRLIADARLDGFVANFTDYWLDLKELRRDEPDFRLYPEYRLNAYLEASIGEETRAYFRAMIRENLPASTIVDSRFVFVNDILASHYGLNPVAGAQMRKVPLPPDSPYGGLLTQASILKVTSNGTTTSPVIRGAWIMERLIGQKPPLPPPGVPAAEPDIRGAKTIREIIASHTKLATCANCHARFDPVGLALENFDIMGAWRDHYRGLEQGRHVTGIDRTGNSFAYTVNLPVDASGRLLDGRTFSGIRQLKQHLAANPRLLARNLLHQFTVYATGTPVRFSDRAEIESILDRSRPSNYGVRDLIHGLVESSIFLGEARKPI